MDNLSQIPRTLSVVKATAALTSAATTVDSSSAFTYAIKGKAYSASQWSTTATPTTDINTAAAFTRVGTSEGCVFVLCLNTSGALKVAQGGIEALDAANAFIRAPQFPIIPSDHCPVAYVITKAGSTAAAKATGFLFGTTNFSGVTGVTHATVDICTLPDRPQIS